MSEPHVRPFAAGTLWDRITQATTEALARGVLRPITTEITYLEDAGTVFPVRRIPHLAAKEQTKSQAGRAHSPFLQADSALHVADVSATHVCLLNRFPVFEHHLLIVTRDYEDQLGPLEVQDFEALGKCMAEYDALGFYNGGSDAGASQRHKHLQLVALPLAPRGTSLPIEPLLARVAWKDQIGHSSALPFSHVAAKLSSDRTLAPRDAAEAALQLYRRMLSDRGLNPDSVHMGPYNLLVTRQWMLLVPRSRDKFRSVSLNALAFAGHFLVRGEQELFSLRDHGPLKVLQEVAGEVPSRRQDEGK